MQAPDRVRAVSAQGSPDNPQSASDLRLQRTLKLVVVGLSILLFAGLMAVIGRVIYLASPSAKQPAAAAALAIQPSQSLQLPAGAQVRSISLSENRIAVQYEAPGSAGIAIFDLKSGRMVTDIAVEPKPAGN
jgi:Family of unknown function (DUF6476)